MTKSQLPERPEYIKREKKPTPKAKLSRVEVVVSKVEENKTFKILFGEAKIFSPWLGKK